jgi:hypothetical protein
VSVANNQSISRISRNCELLKLPLNFSNQNVQYLPVFDDAASLQRPIRHLEHDAMGRDKKAVSTYFGVFIKLPTT